MLPLSDGLRARRFPVVNVALIAANIAVWVLYELPDLDGAVAQASFYPCDVENTCQAPLPWVVGWFTAMFMHGSWDHLLGNLLFLAIFGKNVEDAFGHLRYLGFYVAGEFAATALQTSMTLAFASDTDAQVPMLGASGAISAVLGAFLALYPHARIKTLVLVFFVQIPAWAYLGGWSSTSSIRRMNRSSSPRRTGAAWRSSRTSAGSCSDGSSHGRCWMRGGSTLSRCYDAAPRSCRTERNARRRALCRCDRGSAPRRGRFRAPPKRLTAGMLAFASGALIVAVAFELFEPAHRTVGLARASAALLLGACTFIAVDVLLQRHAGAQAAGLALRFRSTRVSGLGNGNVHVSGDLEAAGTSISLAFDASVNVIDGELELEATTTVDQGRLGMSQGPLGNIRPSTKLHVKARLVREAA